MVPRWNLEIAMAQFRFVCTRLAKFERLGNDSFLLFHQIEIAPFLTLDGTHRAVGTPTICVTIQRHPNREATVVLPDDLNAGDGLAARPLSDGVKALFPQSGVAQSSSNELVSHQRPSENLTPPERSMFAGGAG
jgi:hypothetical protein